MSFLSIKHSLIAFAMLGFATTSAAESVLCHVSYGGETLQLSAQATNTPYRIAPSVIGTYFLFRIVWQKEPADLASLKVYTYANREDGPAILHQASYPYPAQNAAVYGFTGQHSVYEPLRDGELQYWCELSNGVPAQ